MRKTLTGVVHGRVHCTRNTQVKEMFRGSLQIIQKKEQESVQSEIRILSGFREKFGLIIKIWSLN